MSSECYLLSQEEVEQLNPDDTVAMHMRLENYKSTMKTMLDSDLSSLKSILKCQLGESMIRSVANGRMDMGSFMNSCTSELIKNKYDSYLYSLAAILVEYRIKTDTNDTAFSFIYMFLMNLKQVCESVPHAVTSLIVSDIIRIIEDQGHSVMSRHAGTEDSNRDEEIEEQEDEEQNEVRREKPGDDTT